MGNLTLHVGGKAFSDWVSVHVTRSMQQLAADFELTVGGNWSQEGLRPQLAGQTCEIFIAGKRVLTGVIDAAPNNFDATSHALRLEGRDKTADLLDCSVPSLQWIGRSLGDIAADLCKPFGITVINQAGVKTPFKSYKPHEGDTVFATLEQGARYRGVLLLSDVQGNLLITRVGVRRAYDRLVLGENIISGSGGSNLRECFNSYRVKGQQKGSDATTTSSVSATHADSRLIARHRPLTVVCDGPITAGAARTRAQWEASVRYGRALSITYRVRGWQQSNGDLWEPNLLVHVQDAYNGIDGDRLIADVAYNLDDQAGEIVELTVMPKDAFAKLAEPEPEKEDDYGL